MNKLLLSALLTLIPTSLYAFEFSASTSHCECAGVPDKVLYCKANLDPYTIDFPTYQDPVGFGCSCKTDPEPPEWGEIFCSTECPPGWSCDVTYNIPCNDSFGTPGYGACCTVGCMPPPGALELPIINDYYSPIVESLPVTTTTLEKPGKRKGHYKERDYE